MALRWLPLAVAAALLLAPRPATGQCEGDRDPFAVADELARRADGGVAASEASMGATAEEDPACGGESAGPSTSASLRSAYAQGERVVGRDMDRALAAVSLALAAVLAWQLGRRRVALGAWLRAPRWNPYVAGAGLGVVVALSAGLVGRPLSASGAFDRLAAYPGHALFPDATYFRDVVPPAITWPVWLMVGVVLGALASSALAHQARASWLPDAQWVPRFGPSRARRLALAFSGAALVQFGADIAGGCTGSLAISAGALLAPASFLFMAGMFAGGLPTAWFWYRRAARTRC